MRGPWGWRALWDPWAQAPCGAHRTTWGQEARSPHCSFHQRGLFITDLLVRWYVKRLVIFRKSPCCPPLRAIQNALQRWRTMGWTCAPPGVEGFICWVKRETNWAAEALTKKGYSSKVSNWVHSAFLEIRVIEI